MSLGVDEGPKARDLAGVILSVIKGAKALATLDPVGAFSSVMDAFNTYRKTSATVEQRAFDCYRETVAQALEDALGDPAFGSALDAKEIEPRVTRFLEEAFHAGKDAELTAAMLIEPASAPIYDEVRKQFPALLSEVAPEHGLDDAKARKRLDVALGRAAPRVYAAQVSYFRPLVDALDGPVAEGARRRLAWARHADWIRSLYYREPIFAQDEESGISLDKVYVQLRCYHVTEVAREGGGEDGQGGRSREYELHVGWLHERLHDWLADERREAGAVRMVAGGPGSGKSSFARALACEVLDEGKFHVLFIPLQFMRLSADLYGDVGQYLRKHWNETSASGGAGFPKNPLEWRAQDDTPILLIFDGLDELARSDSGDEDLTRRFVERVVNELRGLNGGRLSIRALILGRSTTSQTAREQADLPAEALFYALPLRPVERQDLMDFRRDVPTMTKFQQEGAGSILDTDQRHAFWSRWCSANGKPDEPVPPGIGHDDLEDLNGEPLLLYLLILSGFAEEHFEEAAANRNLVYEAIFKEIYRRNKDKDYWAAKKLTEEDFFTLLECLGLAAWAGNGRVGGDKEFVAIRDTHAPGARRRAYKDLEAAQLKNVAVQFYTRLDVGDTPGFAFIHKSFGEYLTARGLFHGAARLVKRLASGEFDDDERGFAERWCGLVGAAETTPEIITFLHCEARLRQGVIADVLPTLIAIFHWVLANGMPVQREPTERTFRELETRQRCAEAAFLATLSAFSRNAGPVTEVCEAPITAIWGAVEHEARALVMRLTTHTGGSTRLVLVQADLSRANLSGANLSGADLSRADLSRADLIEANLSGADLSGANLRGADLIEANLSGANLSGANLSGANLSGADLIEADLSGANLRGADLSRADLSGADLSGADLSGANLRVANLSGADLSGADLSGANLRGADLEGADSNRLDIDSVRLQSANLKGTKNLTQEQVNVADGNSETVMPEHLRRPDRWPED